MDVQDFSLSWSDGLALCVSFISLPGYIYPDADVCGPNCRCALIHCHRPDLIDYHKLNKVRIFLCTLCLPLFTVVFSSQTVTETHNSRSMWLQNISGFRYVYVALGQGLSAVLTVNVFQCHIQQLLEVADLCDSHRPDERSVMTYIASFFHAFSSMGAYHLFYLRRPTMILTLELLFSCIP